MKILNHPNNYIDLIGKKFGRLSVISRNGNDKSGQALWLCKCDCGKSITTRGYQLRSSRSKSCGCFNKEVNRFRVTTHNESKTNLYLVWNSMKSRCYNENVNNYFNYGGRGIKVCSKWRRSFIEFKKWAIKNNYCEGLTIDRINNNGNYSPRNCRFVSNIINARNKRTSKDWFIFGNIFPSSQSASERIGVSRKTIENWCKSGKKDCFTKGKYANNN